MNNSQLTGIREAVFSTIYAEESLTAVAIEPLNLCPLYRQNHKMFLGIS